MIGQERLLKTLIENDFKCVLLIGPRGHGKKHLAQEVAKAKNLELKTYNELKVDNVREMIEDGQILRVKTMFLLPDVDNNMTTQAQNAALKFIEEPPKNAFIVMTSEKIDGVLPTIQSRSKTFIMNAYTKEHLEKFTTNEILTRIAENPGQIKRMESVDSNGLLQLAEKICENIGRISAANVFSILNHVKEDDLDLLVPFLIFVYTNRIKQNNDRMTTLLILAEQLRIIYKYKMLLKNKSVRIKPLFEIMFMEMRDKAHEIL